MGGHGGLNILPQKKWNVYNYDNRVKVESDQAKHNKHQKEQNRLIHQTNSLRVFNTLRAQNDPTASFPNLDPVGEVKQNPEYQKEIQDQSDRFIKQTTMYLGQTVLDSDLPWYMKQGPNKEIPSYDFSQLKSDDYFSRIPEVSEPKKQTKHTKLKQPKHKKLLVKPSIQQLREERLKRESEERKRAEKLLNEGNKTSKYNDTYSHFLK